MVVAGQTANGQEAPSCVTATQRPLGSGLSFAHTLFDVLTGAFPLINIACGHAVVTPDWLLNFYTVYFKNLGFEVVAFF